MSRGVTLDSWNSWMKVRDRHNRRGTVLTCPMEPIEEPEEPIHEALTPPASQSLVIS